MINLEHIVLIYNILLKSMKAGEAVYHTVLDSEREAFTKHVNEVLKDDKDIKTRLPIHEKEIFEAVGDGVILWYSPHNPANSSTLQSSAKSHPSPQQPSIFTAQTSTTKSRTSTYLLSLHVQSDAQ